MMSIKPLITVVTPVFNLIAGGREKYFRECMDSVHNQDYPNIEHIVVDGLSFDGTEKLINEYVGKGWCSLVRKKDNGIDEAYNNGIEVAKGKYIFFMNSDDFYYSDKSLSICVNKLEEENADYCFGCEQRIQRSGKKDFFWEPKIECFWHDMPFSHQTLGIRRDVLNKLGNYDTSCGYGGDYKLVIDLIIGDYKGVSINEIISYYRLGGVSSQINNKAQQFRTIDILGKRILDFSKNFYSEMDIDDATSIYLEARSNPYIFPKKYINKLIRFMVNLNLKNFDYNSFIQYAINLSRPKSSVQNGGITRFYLFNRILLLKRVIKNNKRRYYLFGFVPVLKITT